jgi:hypothetical protein
LGICKENTRLLGAAAWVSIRPHEEEAFEQQIHTPAGVDDAPDLGSVPSPILGVGHFSQAFQISTPDVHKLSLTSPSICVY